MDRLQKNQLAPKQHASKQLACVVFAGGKSIRMGQDKAKMPLKLLPQEYFVSHAFLEQGSLDIAVLAELDFLWHSLWVFSRLMEKNSCIEPKIYLSCRKEQAEDLKEHIRKYPDIAAIEFILDSGEGACNALLTCLDYLKKPILSLPCDTPYITQENMQALIDLWQKNSKPDIWQYTYIDPVNGRKETLVSLYTLEARHAFQCSIEKKIRIQNTLADEHAVLIPFSGHLRQELFNFNTLNDFVRYSL